MRMQLSKSEMLALWKRRHFLEPLRADCRISRSDGVDLDAVAEDEMRRRYLDMLANAPVELLAPEDVTKSALITRSPRGTALLSLPENVVRVLAVKLDGWSHEALIVPAGSAEALRQTNAYACGGVSHPVAVVNSNRSLELFSLPSRSGLPLPAYILAICDPGPDLYVMDEAGFGQL